MTDRATELSGLATRLAALAERLADEQTHDEEAVALAREAAELSARAGQTIDSALGELAHEERLDADPDVAVGDSPPDAEPDAAAGGSA